MKILISPGFGAGWSTWECNRDAKHMMLTDEKLISAVETTKPESLERSLALDDFLERLRVATGAEPYTGGFHKIEVREVLGSFEVQEYDGSESIVYAGQSPDSWCF